ncbi:MAG: amidohydrolase family protein [Acidimicrobiia bacterium]|nr:amidohydrolase family protein [Acidimicrobiia bacterium]
MRSVVARLHSTVTMVGAFVLLSASACSIQGPAAPPAGTAQTSTATVFEGARVIHGDARPPLERATFVVDGGRISQIGSADQVRAPGGVRRADLTGKTVMPTIIDTHTHLSQTREALTTDLRRRAHYGVSAAMSLGQDNTDVPFQVRVEPIPGAALFRTAGRGITMPEPGRTEAPYWITTEAEGRKAVQELAAKKVDIVKIWVDDRDGKFKKLPRSLYGPIIDEAHKAGLRVTAHIFNLSDAKELLRAGVDAFAHGIRDVDVDDEVMALFKERPRVVVVPNLPDRGVATDMSWLRGSLPDEELTKLQQAAVDRPEAQKAFGIQARNLARLAQAGVRIALGSDGNTPWAPHVEMADMVASGMTAAQVIVAATSAGAEFMGLTDAGVLDVGKRADFIVLDANPLEAVTNTRRISSVYLQGTMVDR